MKEEGNYAPVKVAQHTYLLFSIQKENANLGQ